MKIFFDARYVRTDYHDGISRYSVELGSALAHLCDITFLVCDKAQIALLPSDSHFLIIHQPTSIREPLTARFLNMQKPDVVISPMQTIGSAGRKFKLVLTLHDMIYYRHRTPPSNLSALIRFGWRLYHLSYLPQRFKLNGANMVVTVSETSKRDIVKARLTRKPVVVVPNAPQNLHTSHKKQIKLAKSAPQNLIYMGSFMRYKNVETLIEGLEWIPGRTLHLLSRIAPKRRTQLEARIPKNASVVFHNGVSDKQYADLLADDAILVTASLDEGYGLPLAEALAFGVPAVVSNLAIFHEVASNGALYFDPMSPQDFAHTITELDNLDARKVLVKNGKKYIKNFNWDKSAKILLESIKKL